MYLSQSPEGRRTGQAIDDWDLALARQKKHDKVSWISTAFAAGRLAGMLNVLTEIKTGPGNDTRSVTG
jgi:hypothetical protein